MSKSTESVQFSTYSMKSSRGRTALEDTVSKFSDHFPHVNPNPKQYGDHAVIVGGSHGKGHLDPLMPQIPPISNIKIDTSLPHDPYSFNLPPVDHMLDPLLPVPINPVSITDTVATTEPVQPTDDLPSTDYDEPPIVCYIPPGAHDNGGYDIPTAPTPYPTPAPEPVGVELNDGGFTISMDSEGNIICANPPPSVKDPLMPLYPEDRWSGPHPAPADPAPTNSGVGVQLLVDGGFTVYIYENGNAVCGTPPSPIQTAINDFLNTTEKSHIGSTEAPANTASFADIHGAFELPVNTDAA